MGVHSIGHFWLGSTLRVDMVLLLVLNMVGGLPVDLCCHGMVNELRWAVRKVGETVTDTGGEARIDNDGTR